MVLRSSPPRTGAMLAPSVLGAIAGVAIGLSCNVDPGSSGTFAPHCSDDAGDATCMGAFPSRPYCSLCVDLADHQGCVSSPPVPACRVDGSTLPADDGGTDAADDGDDDDGGSTAAPATSTADDTSDGTDGDSDSGIATVAVDDTLGSDGDSDSGMAPCEDEGELDRACMRADATRPYCVEGACVGCSDAGADEFCGTLSADAPACDAELGACVGCGDVARDVCVDETPVCGATGACAPCTEHVDCPGTACHLWTGDPRFGSCFEDDEVVWVDNDGICPGSGTEASPACSLAGVLGAVDDDEQLVVRLIAGQPYDEDIELDAAATVAVLASGGIPQLVSDPASNGPTFVLGGGAILYAHRLRIIDNPTTHGMSCTGGSYVATETDVYGNDGWGFFSNAPCDVIMRRATIHHNTLGGIRLLGGHASLDNATVGENGTGGGGGGIQLNFATADILYSTIAGNDGLGADSVECNGAMTTGTIRNSVVVGADPGSIDLDCFTFAFQNSALDSPNFIGDENVAAGAYNPAYFVDPEDGNFQLAAPPLTPFGDLALWQDGDPLLDADGTERPTDGSYGYAGIDEP